MLSVTYLLLPWTLCMIAFGYSSNSPSLDLAEYDLQQQQNGTSLARQGRNSRVQDFCQTTEGYTGTCMTRFNCMRQRGVASGFCGTYGVCCETNLQCSQATKLKSTVIKNPAQLSSECVYIIEPYSSNVCQLRIDFEIFDLTQPTLQAIATGLGSAYTCSNYFTVDGITLCGNNDGQHIFVPFNVADGIDHVRLRFTLPNRGAPSKWRLVVTQLECPTPTGRTYASFMPFVQQNSLLNMRTIFSARNADFDLLAPLGCLQYHTAPSGKIQSFNYNKGMGPYMTAMSYAICFKRLSGNSVIEFTSDFFTLPNQGVNMGFDSDCHGTISTMGRQKDYLMIPGAMMNSVSSDIQPTYFCGTSLNGNQIVYSAADGPFVIHFLSDESSVANEDIGFQLKYQIK